MSNLDFLIVDIYDSKLDLFQTLRIKPRATYVSVILLTVLESYAVEPYYIDYHHYKKCLGCFEWKELNDGRFCDDCYELGVRECPVCKLIEIDEGSMDCSECGSFMLHCCEPIPYWHCSNDMCSTNHNEYDDYELLQFERSGHSAGCLACMHPNGEYTHVGCAFETRRVTN